MHKHIQLGVEQNYIPGREHIIDHLKNNLAKSLYNSDALYDQYLMWNTQFKGNGIIYLVQGLEKNGPKYSFTIRIGNNYLDAYTQKEHWFSYRDQNNKLITKSNTTICEVIPAYYRQRRYKRPIQNEEMNNFKRPIQNEEMNNFKRLKCNSSISTNDSNAIHELLSAVRQQQQQMSHMQNQIYSSNQSHHKHSSETENKNILINSLPTKR